MALKSLPFSNPDSQFVALGATLVLAANFTIEFWGNRTGYNSGTGSGARDAVLGGNGVFGTPSLNYYDDRFRLYDAVSDQKVASAVSGFNAWHHYAIVRTGSTFEIYIDGALDSGATGTNNSAAPFSFSTIGYGDQGTYFADMQLEELRVWSVARSAGQIAASYQYVVSPASSGLLAYFNFGEADASTTATDLVAGTYTGTLHGSPTATRVAPTAPLLTAPTSTLYGPFP